MVFISSQSLHTYKMDQQLCIIDHSFKKEKTIFVMWTVWASKKIKGTIIVMWLSHFFLNSKWRQVTWSEPPQIFCFLEAEKMSASSQLLPQKQTCSDFTLLLMLTTDIPHKLKYPWHVFFDSSPTCDVRLINFTSTRSPIDFSHYFDQSTHWQLVLSVFSDGNVIIGSPYHNLWYEYNRSITL